MSKRLDIQLGQVPPTLPELRKFTLEEVYRAQAAFDEILSNMAAGLQPDAAPETQAMVPFEIIRLQGAALTLHTLALQIERLKQRGK